MSAKPALASVTFAVFGAGMGLPAWLLPDEWSAVWMWFNGGWFALLLGLVFFLCRLCGWIQIHPSLSALVLAGGWLFLGWLLSFAALLITLGLLTAPFSGSATTAVVWVAFSVSAMVIGWIVQRCLTILTGAQKRSHFVLAMLCSMAATTLNQVARSREWFDPVGEVALILSTGGALLAALFGWKLATATTPPGPGAIGAEKPMEPAI